ncbi:histidine phosphatase superfamily [Cladochytrium replicatum]|nr:histidine phosphatase superfamily [Cladochytrium replicatum]
MPGHVCLDVTVVRHAETDMNSHVPRILQGHLDAGLNEYGKKQAAAVGWRLRKEKFDHIYSSDLQRALQTTGFIAAHHLEVPLSTDERLREKDLGDLTGMAWPTAKRVLKQEDITFEEHIAGHGGESSTAFEDRVVDFYTELVDLHLIRPHRDFISRIMPSPLTRNSSSAPKESDFEWIPGQVMEPPSPTRANLAMEFPPAYVPPTTFNPDQVPLKTRRPMMPTRNILIVTHGGWIQEILKHLIEELHFPAACEIQTGFPKTTGVFRFRIIKAWKKDGDYEWEGKITGMNSVAHLAGLNQKVLVASPGTKDAGDAPAIVLGANSPLPPQSPVVLRRAEAKKEKANKNGIVDPAPKEQARIRSLGW